MKKAVWWSILLFGSALIAAIVYYAITQAPQAPQPQPQSEPSVAAAPASPVEPQIRHPVPDVTREKPLPALDTSDATMSRALGKLWSDKAVEDRFQLRDFIRRVVATIDSLPRKKIAVRLLPVKQAPGSFLAAGADERFVISPENAARYAPYLRLADSIDSRKLVELYVHFYPLFQQAYEDLGYPKAYFNDRLIEVIDDMLNAPELTPPVRLVRPKVFYEYADPELESRSAGQKILMRVGPENAVRMKAKLREIRAALVSQGPSGGR